MKTLKILVLIFICFCFFMFSIQTTFAANITINDTSTGGILAAINDMAVNPGDTIFLDSGTYNKLNNDTNITITKNVTIQGNGPTDSVIIDARRLSRIFNLSNNLNVTFINITFINGYVPSENGAAISNGISNATTTSITLINCTFIDNVAEEGGAIYNWGSNLNVFNSTFIGNNATSGVGGAIHNYGSNVQVDKSNFINNSADDGGGAIYNHMGNNFSVTNSNFRGNEANTSDGGAIYNNNGTDFTITNSNFTNNRAFLGGAIYNTNGANFSVFNSNFTNNSASYRGGAIHDKGANSTVAKCTFIDNIANEGGAIFSDSTAENFNIDSSIFINNSADRGGAICNHFGDNISVTSSNFTNNSAYFAGGAIENRGNMSVSGNTMTGNNAAILGHVIYNDGNMTNLILTYLDNTTKQVLNNTPYTIYATLTDDMGNPVTGGNITFDNPLIDSVTSVEGQVSITRTFTSLGIIPVIGAYSNNGLYPITIRGGQIQIVSKFTTNSTINVISSVGVNQTIDITGILTDFNGNPIPFANITIVVANQTFNRVTDIFGAWSVSYTTIIVGNINVLVTWAGNNIYFGFRNSTRFTVADSVVPRNLSNNLSYNNLSNNLSGNNISSPNNFIPSDNKRLDNDSKDVSDINDSINTLKISMKPTGMPLAIFFLIAIFSSVIYRRKRL